ncbi:MAG: carboxypeptidase-like regulatory domain-containing protein [Candidatus Polarisedimenticolia bacterium]
MRRYSWIWVFLILLMFRTDTSSVPAVSSGALRLQVAQSEGSAPVEGATIIVIDPQMSVFRREARTDGSGRAEISDLAPRDYYLRVEKEEYASYESTFTARAGETTLKRVVLDQFGGAPPSEDPD